MTRTPIICRASTSVIVPLGRPPGMRAWRAWAPLTSGRLAEAVNALISAEVTQPFLSSLETLLRKSRILVQLHPVRCWLGRAKDLQDLGNVGIRCRELHMRPCRTARCDNPWTTVSRRGRTCSSADGKLAVPGQIPSSSLPIGHGRHRVGLLLVCCSPLQQSATTPPRLGLAHPPLSSRSSTQPTSPDSHTPRSATGPRSPLGA